MFYDIFSQHFGRTAVVQNIGSKIHFWYRGSDFIALVSLKETDALFSRHLFSSAILWSTCPSLRACSKKCITLRNFSQLQNVCCVLLLKQRLIYIISILIFLCKPFYLTFWTDLLPFDNKRCSACALAFEDTRQVSDIRLSRPNERSVGSTAACPCW